MKYIMRNDSRPFLFPADQSHKAVAKAIGGKFVSAAFCKIVNGKIFCFGHSEGLDLGPRESDPAIIETWMQLDE